MDTPPKKPTEDPPLTVVQEVQTASTSGQCPTAQLQVIHVGLHNFNTCFGPTFQEQVVLVRDLTHIVPSS